MSDYIDYPDLSEDLSQVYLEDSHVLSIYEVNNRLVFAMAFAVAEDSVFYTPPGPNEPYCEKRGFLVFSNTSKVNWISQSLTPIVEEDDKVHYGNIDHFVLTTAQYPFRDNVNIEAGQYFLAGNWGEIAFLSDSPSIQYDDDLSVLEEKQSRG